MASDVGAAVVTGIGVLVPGCDSRQVLWNKLIDGESSLVLGHNPAIPEQRIAMGRIADDSPHFQGLPALIRERWSREQRLHLASLLSARSDAGLDHADVASERIGVFDGTSRTNFGYLCERLEQRGRGEAFTRRDLVVGLPNHAAALAAVELGFRGPALTFSASCASGAVAIAHAAHAVERGEIDVAYATGHDTPLFGPIYEMYGSAGLLSLECENPRQALRPFVDSSGTVFGEGSVTLTIERREHARRRGRAPIATILASVQGNTGTHPMNVDTTGEAPARVLTQLLDRAGVSAQSIDFVLGHGNGVGATYEAEIGFMRRVFGARSAMVPLLSTKPNFGHMMAAASALDAATAALATYHRRAFSTLNVDPRRTPHGIRHDATIANEHGCQRGISVAFGMGGHISALLFESASKE